MNQSYFPSDSYAIERNKVLQNALNLVGLSMIPTALAAWLVSLIPFSYYAENPILSLTIFVGNFLLSLGLMFWALKSRNSGFGVLAMLLFASSMGAMMGPMINKVLHLQNGTSLIISAALATAAALFSVTTYIKVTKKDFSFMGSFLSGALIGIIVMGMVGMFFHSTMYQLILSSFSVIIFIGFLLYDVSKIVNGGETNYISAAISLYLDVINIFINLLQIFSSGSTDD